MVSTKLTASTSFTMDDVALPPGSRLTNRFIEAGISSSKIQIRDYINNKVTEPTGDEETAQLKTLVWEVSCNHQNGGNCSVSKKVEKFHIVSATKTSDKVDLSLLRDLVNKHQGLPFGCVPSTFSMAPKEIAETLTGFESGCMPPIGHNVPMKLYLDKSISEYPIASIGSGTMDHSILLPMRELKKVAEASGQEVIVGSFSRSRLQYSSLSMEGADEKNIAQQSTTERNDRRPEQKDRLREYRSFSDMASKAKLLRTTARKKGRIDMMVELVEEAVKTSDLPHLLQVSENDGPDKNALHLSSWGGDFEVVKLLVETTKKCYPELDFVNMHSRGPGNYGKTPIFYALTQCREDVVRYLVSQGASLLFVNNKGQTPCSIAVSHLEKECCEFLYETELRQLQRGGKFSNFRISHSDERLYGDLDPRFRIDEFNMEDDLTMQLEQYANSTASKGKLPGGYPISFHPRSLRPTVRSWKREDISMAIANNGDTSGQLTLTQPRIKGRPQKSKKPEQQQSRRRKPCPEKALRTTELESYDRLTIDKVLSSNLHGNKNVVLVNCMESIGTLESEVNSMKKLARKAEEGEETTRDDSLVNSVWGLDCEWLPGKDRGKNNPVSTLQLSTQKRAFLIDLQCLCRATHLESSDRLAAPTDVELYLCSVLKAFFTAPNLSIIGFGILQDLGKLAGSFPHLSCFTFYNSVIDLQSVSNVAVSKSERQNMTSLNRMVGALLQRRLDKTQQCSDWTGRPLLKDQLDYAVLDAAILPLLLTKLLETATVQRYKGQFFATHANLRSRVRFTFLPKNVADIDGLSREKLIWDVPMGRTITICSREIARQSWPTNQSTPDLPKLVPVESGSGKKEQAHL